MNTEENVIDFKYKKAVAQSKELRLIEEMRSNPNAIHKLRKMNIENRMKAEDCFSAKLNINNEMNGNRLKLKINNDTIIKVLDNSKTYKAPIYFLNSFESDYDRPLFLVKGEDGDLLEILNTKKQTLPKKFPKLKLLRTIDEEPSNIIQFKR